MSQISQVQEEAELKKQTEIKTAIKAAEQDSEFDRAIL